jgi:hypothetical protein
LKYIATPKPSVPLISIVFQYNRAVVFNTTGVDIIESLNEMMGFLDDATIVLSLTATAVGFTCESTTPISMSPGVQNLYMVINNSCQNYANTSVDNTFSSSNILAKIPIATPLFSTLFFFDINSNFSTIITNRYLDNLSFTLFNEQFTEITPRKNYSFTIRIDIVVPSANIDNKNTLEQILDLKKLSYCIIMRPNFKKVGRRARNTFKRVGTVIRKGVSVIRSILGTIDNASGGALTSKLQSDPRSAMLLGQVNSLADRDARMNAREQNRKLIY